MSQQIDSEITNHNTVKEICKPFVLDNDTLRKIKDLFLKELKLGLCKSTHDKAAVKCPITYVQSLPTGCEAGKFLALDLGGKNFRVTCINMQGREDFRIESDVFEIDEQLMAGPGKDLFDYVADGLAKFLKTIEVVADEKLPLGFTFSFPCAQTDLDKGILLAWTKGFNCPGVVGEDVVAMLREAIDRKGITNVWVTALLNVATGTLVSCAWKNPYCKIGLTIDAELNSCYLEKVKNVNTFQPEPNNRVPTMIINCESAAFGDNGILDFVRSKYDDEIDEDSPNRRRKLFEKMVADMYLGEMVRILMLECCKAGALFDGYESEQLATKNMFEAIHISKMEEDAPGTYEANRTVLEKMGYKNAASGDCENVRYICECVCRRSASLVSTVLSCLVDRIGDPYTVIGIDGSIYRHHPHYRNVLKEKIQCLARPEYKFDLMLSEDGSGRGAALVAAVVSSLEKKELEKTENRTVLK